MGGSEFDLPYQFDEHLNCEWRPGGGLPELFSITVQEQIWDCHGCGGKRRADPDCMRENILKGLWLRWRVSYREAEGVFSF